jgi:hypothetical protein
VPTSTVFTGSAVSYPAAGWQPAHSAETNPTTNNHPTILFFILTPFFSVIFQTQNTVSPVFCEPALSTKIRAKIKEAAEKSLQ